MNEIKEYPEKIFEDIKHIDEFGHEYWLARELQSVLGYNQWRSINDLIERAIVACQESKYNVDDHFAVQRKMIKLAKGATRKVVDYKLSRYAYYLVVMNGNPNKEVLNNLYNSKIYRTDQDGSIMFKIKNNKLKIETCSP